MLDIFDMHTVITPGVGLTLHLQTNQRQLVQEREKMKSQTRFYQTKMITTYCPAFLVLNLPHLC